MSEMKLLIYGLMGAPASILELGNYSVWSQLLFFMTIHSIASVVFALLLALLIPGRFNVRRRVAVVLIFSFVFFMPFFGAIGLLVVLIYFRYFQHFQSRTEFYNLPPLPFMAESGGLAPGMGEGGAWSRLRTQSLPRIVRLKALMAVSSSMGQNTSRLLQMATSDPDDEIRLLAFNLYDQREKVISASISDALHSLRYASDDEEQVLLNRQLAFSYWEMVFNELNNDLVDFFITQSLHYACQARELGSNDPSLLILMGRIYLHKGDSEQASEYINLGFQQGAHRDRVIPYLAELAYLRRDFKSLKRYFETDPLLRFKPGIGPVAKFWMG